KLGQLSADPTATQQQGVKTLIDTAGTMPNFGPGATTVANTLLSGGPADYSGILSSGYDNLQRQLSPFASGSMVGKNMALQNQLDVAGNDVKNQIESQFAAAGRPPGTNADVAQATARGITQAQAPIIANQYNQDVANQLGAAGALFGGAGSTASGLTGLSQTRLGNMLQGLGAAGAVPGILNQGGNALLSAGN